MNLKKNIKKLSNNKELEAKCFLTTYKDAEKYSKTTTLVLTRDNTFYIDMFLHNNTVELLENIHIDFLGNDELIIKIQSSDNDFNMYPYTDRFVRIKGEVLNSRHVHRIPTLIIWFLLNPADNSKQPPSAVQRNTCRTSYALQLLLCLRCLLRCRCCMDIQLPL